MLLKKLTLTNFRPFKGDHVMNFSTDREKNVTLVIAENGAGKTTLAQAFQWVLYGKTDGFAKKNVLNSIVEKEMANDSEEKVTVCLELEHNNSEYTIIRTQVYRKNKNGNIKKDNSQIEIYKRDHNGNSCTNNSAKNATLISSILPESLSRYFFFDGERIEKMAEEINAGKSSEFKTAVQNILGLTALTNAIEHLNPKSKNSVIGKYNAQLDELGDGQAKNLRETIYESNDTIDKNNKIIEEIEKDIEWHKKRIEETKSEILSFSGTEKLQQQLNSLNDEYKDVVNNRNRSINVFAKNFTNGTYTYMSRQLVKDALMELKNTDSLDKGIPDIRKGTIDFLMERQECICGADLSDPNSKATKALENLLEYIPPQSLGGAINSFKTHSNDRIRSSKNFYDTIESVVKSIRESNIRIEYIENEIGNIDQRLLKFSDKKVASLKNRQVELEQMLKKQEDRRFQLTINNELSETEKHEAEIEISKLQMKMKRSKDIDLQLNYATEAYNIIKKTYDGEEDKTRKKLEKEINTLFKEIYSDGMTINIDNNYRITTYVNTLEDNSSNIDANTAKSYSITFAFIMGIIKLAKIKVADEKDESSIVTDEYPLVMDAPLSSFDKRRIKNICNVIPNIARQAIIFIKDSDGEIAKREMQNKIGINYKVALKDRDYPVDSVINLITEGSDY